MKIAWSGKSKRSHTMWVFKIQATFVQKCVMPVYVDDIDYSNVSNMKQSWLGHAWYVECIVFLNQCKVALKGYALKRFYECFSHALNG